MNEFRTKIGENGRMVIPAALRHQLHIKAGSELIIRIEDEELRISTIKSSLRKIQDIACKHYGKQSLVKKLKAMRKRDFKNEQKNSI